MSREEMNRLIRSELPNYLTFHAPLKDLSEETFCEGLEADIETFMSVALGMGSGDPLWDTIYDDCRDAALDLLYTEPERFCD